MVLLIGMVSFPVSTCPLEYHSLHNNYKVSPLVTHSITFDVVVVSGVVALVHLHPISSSHFSSLSPSPWNCCSCDTHFITLPHPPPMTQLRHCAKDRIVPTNTGSVLLIRCLRVTDLVELGRRCQHTAAEPHRVPLHMMRNHRHVNWLGLQKEIYENKSDRLMNYCISVASLLYDQCSP